MHGSPFTCLFCNWPKNWFVSLVRVRSMPVIWLSPSMVHGTLNSYQNSFMQCTVSFRYLSSFRTVRIYCFPLASLLIPDIGNAAHPIPFFFISFGITNLSPVNSKPNRSVLSQKNPEKLLRQHFFSVCIGHMFLVVVIFDQPMFCVSKVLDQSWN